MSIKPAKVQFNGGELSPWLEGRIDVAQYDKTAKLCRNFVPLAEGCLKRRGGTKFVAMTPEDEGVTLTVYTVPEGAVVKLNGIEGKKITVERGDTVSIEAMCDGYLPYKGEGVIVEDAVITISLTALTKSCVLEIETEPEDALVKIEGIERRRYVAAKNSLVGYRVSHEFYDTVEDSVLMEHDKKLLVQLKYGQENDIYGDWGAPSYFVACAQVGDFKNLLKSFVIRFTRGYLVVMFSSKLVAPDTNCQMWFVYTDVDVYNSVAWQRDGNYYLTNLYEYSDEFRYYSADGKLIFGVSLSLEAPVFGWAVDEEGHYVAYYKHYDGEVDGHIIRVKYKGKEIWRMKERTI